jgi:hydrogenase maturation protease
MDTVAVVGCGNIVRGDDGVGVAAVHALARESLPDHVKLVDAGTGGMDVLFHIEGARRAILIDAVQGAGQPGEIFRVPSTVLEELPPVSPDAMTLHQFRWNHALALGRLFLRDRFPEQVTVFLVEAEDIGYRLDLTPPVQAALPRLLDLVRREWDLSRAPLDSEAAAP